MKEKGVFNISIEYGKESLKKIITNLLREEYKKYITIDKCRGDSYKYGKQV